MSVAACPLLRRATEDRRILCDDVRCSGCGLYRELLEDLGGPELVCAACMDGDHVLGVHASGRCVRCGEDRLLLMPVIHQ